MLSFSNKECSDVSCMKNLSVEGHGEKLRGRKFLTVPKLRGMLKEWDDGPMYHKFAYGCQMVVGRHFVYRL